MNIYANALALALLEQGVMTDVKEARAFSDMFFEHTAPEYGQGESGERTRSPQPAPKRPAPPPEEDPDDWLTRSSGDALRSFK